jgi:hypothetical protein
MAAAEPTLSIGSGQRVGARPEREITTHVSGLIPLRSVLHEPWRVVSLVPRPRPPVARSWPKAPCEAGTHDATLQAFHPYGQHEQPLPQRGDVCHVAVRTIGLLPQRLHQDIRRRRQQYAALIRQKRAPVDAVQREAIMQYLEPALPVTTRK